MRKLLAGLIFALITIIVDTGTANADHDNKLAHWGHGFSPAVTADCGAFGGSLCHFTADAEATWVNAGFRNGFRVNQPFYGCGLIKGYISVCGEPLRSRGWQGYAQVQFIYNPNTHIDAALIRICTDCGISHSRMHRIIRHEYGHIIGLGHTGDSNSIMYWNTGRYITNHDRQALWTYNVHYEG